MDAISGKTFSTINPATEEVTCSKLNVLYLLYTRSRGFGRRLNGRSMQDAVFGIQHILILYNAHLHRTIQYEYIILLTFYCEITTQHCNSRILYFYLFSIFLCCAFVYRQFVKFVLLERQTLSSPCTQLRFAHALN